MVKKTVSKKKPIKAKIEVDCDDVSSCGCDCKKPRGGCFYGLGFLGSAIYFISTATSFWGGVLGVLKSLVWPAFMVFELFKFLKA
jgi:hypothetical protein